MTSFFLTKGVSLSENQVSNQKGSTMAWWWNRKQTETLAPPSPPYSESPVRTERVHRPDIAADYLYQRHRAAAQRLQALGVEIALLGHEVEELSAVLDP
jgi:hypothetical protein